MQEHPLNEFPSKEEFINDFIQYVRKAQGRLGPYTKQDDANRIESAEDVQELLRDAKEILLALMEKREATR